MVYKEWNSTRYVIRCVCRHLYQRGGLSAVTSFSGGLRLITERGSQRLPVGLRIREFAVPATDRPRRDRMGPGNASLTSSASVETVPFQLAAGFRKGCHCPCVLKRRANCGS